MSTDILILGLLWLMSFLYPDFVSSLFEPILVISVGILGLFYAAAHYLKRAQWDAKEPMSKVSRSGIRYYVLSAVHTLSPYFLPLLSLLLLRSFVLDISRVVSGSLKPTILVGDTILVNKYRYGIRLPLKGTVIIPVDSPKRGDIISFRMPIDPSKVFIKRVIGLPGDHIHYQQKRLTINGELISQSIAELVHDEESGQSWHMLKSEENLLGRKHAIYTALNDTAWQSSPVFNYSLTKDLSLKVPDGKYFVMGDNRDNSLDSRHWGFVPADCLLGEVRYIVFSWNSTASWRNPLTWIRWERLGTKVI